jgi:hypothetical protein
VLQLSLVEKPTCLDLIARAAMIIGLGGETCAKSSATPITTGCAPRRSFHRTLEHILRNAGPKGNDDGPETV